jgi:DNA polymerase-3 subunit epsilon
MHLTENPDRMVEIGCVELVNRKLTGNNLHFYLNPERDSEEGACAYTASPPSSCSDKPKFAAISRGVARLCGGCRRSSSTTRRLTFPSWTLSWHAAGHQPFKHYVGSVTDTLVMAKEMYPGKRNGLDALCDRLEVDNSGRTLHGALLDAELLADVYINMTRGQDALVMDAAPTSDSGVVSLQIDLRGFVLPVVAASAQELAGHEDVLAQIDKSSGGKTLWRKMASS